MRYGEKKGQVTLYIIIALAIILVLIIFLVYPRVNLPGSGSADATPEEYLRSCIGQEIPLIMEDITSQGGSMQPQGFIVYNNTKISYLCYTAEYYKTCVVQQPNLIGQVEREISRELQPIATSCVKSFAEEYESRGYKISYGNTNVNASLALNSIKITLNLPMTVTKDFSRTYKSIDLEYKSGIYEILSLATSIIDFESTYGDSETRYYPNIKIEKVKLSDGSKIYSISDVVSKDRFVFASRSLAWPAGYGLE